MKGFPVANVATSIGTRFANSIAAAKTATVPTMSAGHGAPVNLATTAVAGAPTIAMPATATVRRMSASPTLERYLAAAWYVNDAPLAVRRSGRAHHVDRNEAFCEFDGADRGGGSRLSEGAEHMAQLARDVGVQRAEIVQTKGKPAVFATLEMGPAKTVGLLHV
ncbi:MAG: hypothetical protein ABR526_08255 [Chthoniobacterales bacterium]